MLKGVRVNRFERIGMFPYGEENAESIDNRDKWQVAWRNILIENNTTYWRLALVLWHRLRTWMADGAFRDSRAATGPSSAVTLFELRSIAWAMTKAKCCSFYFSPFHSRTGFFLHHFCLSPTSRPWSTRTAQPQSKGRTDQYSDGRRGRGWRGWCISRVCFLLFASTLSLWLIVEFYNWKIIISTTFNPSGPTDKVKWPNIDKWNVARFGMLRVYNTNKSLKYSTVVDRTTTTKGEKMLFDEA